MASYLLDTNVLLRLADPRAPEHEACLRAVRTLRASSNRRILAPQAMYEFWAVATRPVGDNGYDWESQTVASHLRAMVQLFDYVPDPSNLPALWIQFVEAHDVRGKRAHDARLVVFAQALAIDHILTLNAKDFRTWGVSTKNPNEVH